MSTLLFDSHNHLTIRSLRMIPTLPYLCGRLTPVLLIFLCLGLFARPTQAQTPGSCGTDDYTRRLMQTDSAYRNFVRNAKAVQSTDKAANDAILTIPVVFVVYHLGEPVGQGSNVAEVHLQRQVTLMNRLFSTGSSAFKDNGATDSRIRFVMARRGPGCSPINGVVRVDGRAVPDYESVGVDYLDLHKETQLRDLTGDAVNQIRGQAVIVRVYWQVSGAAGWAGFGGDIRVSAPTMQDDRDFNSVLTHEMGHVLFLHHTFSGGDDNVNCPPNTDPNTQGDEVADTDPHLIRKPDDACLPASETMINGCTGRPFGRIGRNIMSYGCSKYIFTPGQIARMRGYLAGSLAGFANSSYALPPATEQIVRAAACTPTSSVSATPTLYHSEGIARVQLGALTNSTNFYGNVPLLRTDLSCGQQTVLRAGQSYTLTIDAPNNNQHRRVYIDWNNDGAFDEASERAFSTQIGDETGTITVPANAVTTQALRMRVVLCDGPVPPSACLVPAFGAAQDFGVRIELANTPILLRVGQLNTLTYCAGQSIALPYTLSGGGNLSTEPVRAELSDATGSFASATVLTTGTGGLLTTELPANLPTASAYRIRLVPTNATIPVDQTPALTIRQLPAGTLVGPSATNEGQTVSLTLALTGNGPWQVEYQVTGLYQYTESLTVTASPLLLPIVVDSYQTIQVFRINNECLAISNGAALTLNPACAPPENLTETMYAWGQTDLNWQTLKNRSYIVQWKQQTAANWTTLPTQSWTTTTLTDLLQGQTYQWRVAATCANSLSSAFSPTRTFSFSCLMPANVTEQVTQNSASLRWDGSANTSYTLRWRQAGNTTWTNVPVAFWGYTMPSVVAGRTYEWQVSSVCSNSTTSVFTPLRSFTVMCSPPVVYEYVDDITASSALVSWRTLAGQQYRVRWRAASAATWTTLNWVTTDSQSLTGLPGGQTIEWQVQTRCSDASESGFSSGSFFTTLCPVPPVPVVSGISATSALIQLAPVTAKDFWLYYRKAGTGGYRSIFILNNGPATYALTGLDHNAAYEVALAQTCPNNVRTGQSAPASFTTVNCAPPAVVSFTGSPTAIWGQSTTLVATLTGVSPWSVLLTTGESFTGLTTSPARLVSRLPDFGYAQLNISVARIANACQTVNWSGPYVAMQVADACGAAPINLRVGQQGTNYVTLLWDDAQRVDNYTLQWRQVGSTSWNTVENAYSNYWLTNLTYGQAYEWRVEPVCYRGQPVTSSAIQSFTMSCPLPTGMTELYSPTEARLSWNWQASAGVPVDYTLRWRAAGTPTWTTIPNLSNSVYMLTGLTPNTAYEWQLQTNCIGSGMGPASPIRSFTTGCGMPQLYYTSNLTSTSVTMNWLSQTPDAQYVLRWRIFTPTSWTTSPTMFTGSSGRVTGLQGEIYHEVQLQAVCANGQRSPFTESFYVYPPCSNMYSVRTGNWNDPNTWSCNRIPALGETVRVSVGHTVTIPASTTAYARTVQEHGRLMVAAGAKLQLGL